MNTPLPRSRRGILPMAMLAGTILAAAAHAQPVRLPPPEEEDDAYRANPHFRTTRPYQGHGGGGVDTFTAQVNISSGGQNIIGDAANEPTLAIDPTNPSRMTIGWRQFDSVSSNFRQGGKAWSDDGGNTWHNTGVLTPGTFRSDPVMDADAGGNFKYLDLTTDLLSWVFTSTDSGHTWGGPFASFGADKEWMVIDKTNGPGRGFIHQAWQVNGPYGSTPYTRSTNGGITWMNPIAIPGPPIFGTMAVGPSGELYIAGINPNSGAFTIDKSTNANNSAVTPTFTTTTVNMGGSFTLPNVADPNPVGLEGQVYVAVDTSGGARNGWVYMLATLYTGGADPQDIMFARSTDGGATWSAPVRVNNDASAANHYQWMGTLSVSPNGRIDAVWNDTRESLAYNLNRVYYAFSTDGGSTWQGNVPVTPQYDCTLGWPQQNKIGDYYTMISDRYMANLAFAATFNGEEDVYFLRISACYANCDESTTTPVLNANDFQCFLNRFAAQDSYANCDGSTVAPILNANDFQCYLNKFAAGCS